MGFAAIETGVFGAGRAPGIAVLEGAGMVPGLGATLGAEGAAIRTWVDLVLEACGFEEALELGAGTGLTPFGIPFGGIPDAFFGKDLLWGWTRPFASRAAS